MINVMILVHSNRNWIQVAAYDFGLEEAAGFRGASQAAGVQAARRGSSTLELDTI